MSKIITRMSIIVVVKGFDISGAYSVVPMSSILYFVRVYLGYQNIYLAL